MPGLTAPGRWRSTNPTTTSPPSAGRATGEPFIRWRIPRERVDFTREVVLPMAPGDAAFFTNRTWHRAEPNCSGRHLCAYAIAYQRREE